MKKLIIILSFMISFNIELSAQTFKTYADTANYLMNIESKKSNYIGKPFSVLYDSLKIKPVFAIAEYANKKEDFGKVLRLYFNYLYWDFEHTHILIVDFGTTCPPYNTLYPLLFPGVDQPINIAAIANLYKPLIVKDIVTKDYYEGSVSNPVLLTNTPTQSNAAITNELKNAAAKSNAGKYYNQPFSVLWNDLPVKPKTVWDVSGNPDDDRVNVSKFFFESPDKLSTTYIQVYWKNPIPKSETQQYQLSIVRDFTNPAEYAVYANKTIADILIYPTSLYPNGAVANHPGNSQNIIKSKK